MTLESNKALGGVGALLMVISPFGNAGVLGLIGLILVLIALKRLSDYYNERSIFSNALYGVIIVIVGVVVTVAVIVGAAFGLLSDLDIEPTTWGDWSAFQQIDWQAAATWDIIWPYVAVIVGSLLALFVFVVVGAIFLRRSLNSLSAKTGVNIFGTAGLLMLIGAALTIIVVGFIILWVALILLTVAFFSIRTEPTQPSATTPPPSS